MNNVKATIEYEDKRITFEGPSEFVESQVKLFTTKESKKISTHVSTNVPTDNSPARLVKEKLPKGHHEIVAVLAFSLAEQGLDEFSEEDMRRAYLHAHIRPPKVIGQALRDAKNKYDLILLGKKRGTYRLSPHGDRTVRFDLPKSST